MPYISRVMPYLDYPYCVMACSKPVGAWGVFKFTASEDTLELVDGVTYPASFSAIARAKTLKSKERQQSGK